MERVIERSFIQKNTGGEDLNRVQQGRWNAERIRKLVCDYPVMTASLVSHVTGMPEGTVRNQLRQLAKLKRVTRIPRGMGEEYLYLPPQKRTLAHVDHELGRSEVWIALEAGAALIGETEDKKPVERGTPIKVQREDPKEFESSKGIVKPDWVFSLELPGKEKRFFTWEEDKGTMKEKDECLHKYEGMWWWRKENCHEPFEALKKTIRDPQELRAMRHRLNRWKIPNIRVLTSAPDEKRMKVMLETSLKAHPEGVVSDMFYFTHRELWDYRKPWQLFDEPIWVTGKDDRRRSILE